MSIDQEIIEVQEEIEKKTLEVEANLKQEDELRKLRSKLYLEITNLEERQDNLVNKL